ncbi:methyl-accepting chemotaxis protein [Bacillus sp. J14TS2]|uniref:methyl-accepting chemotaxis protein n=1 Tax=Bacillus sp. J14TS2 TaxID=2807188 RepID=UPI001B1A2F08|nr:methyl-accepting chemotaxis protein [Bacillus sp. J14TS2]GIN70014.1 methyl-accepting chemotaxis protein [Bacillus sp. J14TS2]
MNKKKHTRMTFKIRDKLAIAFALVLIIPSLTIAFTSYESSKRNIEKQILGTAQDNVDTVSHSVDQFIEKQMENVNYLANTFVAGEITSDDHAQTRQVLDKFQASTEDVEQTYVGTETGKFMNAPTTFENPPDYDPRERPWYQQAIEHPTEVIITEPYVSQSSNQMVVTLAKSTADGKGVAAVNLKLESLTEMINQVSIGSEGYVFLLDTASHFISHPTSEAGSEATEDFFKKIYKSQSGHFSYELDGYKKQLAFTTSEVTGWKVNGTMYQNEVDQAVQPIFRTTVLVILISIILSAIAIVFIIRSINKPINTLVTAATEISRGNLSENVVLKSGDELGQLAEAFNKMRTHLHQVISQVREQSSNLAAASEQLNASTEQNTLATEQISASIQEVAAGIESQTSRIDQSSQMAGSVSQSISHIAKASDEVAHSVTQTQPIIEAGKQDIETSIGQMSYIHNTVSELSTSVKLLNNRSQQISQIVNVITDIAEQTNLLALNAAIEAARAGEHGKGFAVVASEVKKLAEQSASSTEEIRKLISTIQQEVQQTVSMMESGTNEVDKGIHVVENAHSSFNTITQYVQKMTAQMAQITTNIQQVATGTEQFTHTFKEVASVADTTSAEAQNMSASTEEQLASMEEIRGSSTALAQMAEELHELVQQFKL